MRKIPSLFRRDWSREVPATPEVASGCGWVLDPLVPTVATRKSDGTCCLVWRGMFYRRRTVASSDEAPTDFVTDARLRGVSELVETSDLHGWVPVDPGDPEDRYHLEGLRHASDGTPLPDGTYELVGPKVGGNPHGLDAHTLWRHGVVLEPSFVGSKVGYSAVARALADLDAEGVVFHELFGDRAAKVKRTDFGLDWPA